MFSYDKTFGRHDVMIVDPIQNILVDRESGEPLMIDFGRGAQLTKVVASWLVGWVGLRKAPTMVRHLLSRDS